MPALTPRKICTLVVQALDDGKAEDIKSVDVRKLTSIADYMVIATGRSSRQVKGLADRVLETAREQHLKPLGVEGERNAEWILIDFGDVIVHVMQPEPRQFYQLEKLWEAPKRARAAAAPAR
ncbi:MAG: ribosome silencing factor [Gammaproteobacteria bacterium]